MTAAPVTPVRGDLAHADALLDLGSRICGAYGLPDLAARLSASRAALARTAVHLVVAGDFKRGKSSLVNALLGAVVCPVDDSAATAVPTYVRHGSRPAAELVFDGEPARREPVDVPDVGRFVVEGAGPGRPAAAGAAAAGIGAGAAGAGDAVDHVEIQLPHEVLADGLVVVDTPGVGGLGSAYAAGSLAAISMAEAVLFVTDAEQPLTRNELAFLRHARTLCGTVRCVLTKTDFYPGWRAVREADERELDGLDIPIIAASAPLRVLATETGDAELDAESGFAELDAFVADVRAGAARRVAAGAAVEVVTVCDQILGQFKAERAALAGPAAARQVTGALTAGIAGVAALREPGAAWRHTLDGGVDELIAALDADMRTRIGLVVDEAGDAIEAGDPADTWPQLPSWLQSRITPELIENYALLCRRVDDLADDVARRFHAAADRGAVGAVTAERDAADDRDTMADRGTPGPVTGAGFGTERGRAGAGGSAMLVLKQAYGGDLRFGTLGGFSGIVLSPISVGISLVMGHTGLRDEKERELVHRRAQAIEAVRRYCDEVIIVMGRDSREALRRIQRRLHDRYRTLADDRHRSYAMALDAVAAAGGRGDTDRGARVADLDAELARLRDLRQRARAAIT